MHRPLFILSSLKDTGPTKQLIALLNGLAEHRVSVDVVILKATDGRYVKRISLIKSVKIISVWSALAKVFRREYSVVNSIGFTADYVNAVFLSSCPKVSMRRSDYFSTNLDLYPLLGTIQDFCSIWIYKSRFSMVVHTNQLHASQAINFKIPSPIVLDNVITFDYTVVRQTTNNTMVKRCAIIGDVTHNKNQQFILDSIIGIVNENIEFHFYGLDKIGLFSWHQAAHRQNCYYHGRVESVLEEIVKADLVVSASLSEGMPNAVLESLALGTPVLLSNIFPHSNIVGNFDDVGLLFDLNKTGDFESKLNQILNAINNYQFDIEKVRSKYSAYRVTEELLNFYSEII